MSIDVIGYKVIWVPVLVASLLGHTLLIPYGCLVGRPILEIKKESVVRGRIKSKKIILRIQPFLRLPMFGVNGG